MRRAGRNVVPGAVPNIGMPIDKNSIRRIGLGKGSGGRGGRGNVSSWAGGTRSPKALVICRLGGARVIKGTPSHLTARGYAEVNGVTFLTVRADGTGGAGARDGSEGRTRG
jgi:hypothetical protein